MEQTLLNEIVARVAAKLAEAEGGEAASAAASRDDREGLLLLSQEMNDTCRAMLKCEKLKARFRVCLLYTSALSPTWLPTWRRSWA